MEDKDRTLRLKSRFEAQCAKREYCVSDLREKLMKATDGDSDVTEKILSSLITEGYADDLRYASAFAREKASLTGWGPVKIRYSLASKSIDKEIIDAALEGIDADKAQDRLERLMQARWKTLEGDPQAKLKLLKFALSRGYGYDLVGKTADMITHGNG